MNKIKTKEEQEQFVRVRKEMAEVLRVFLEEKQLKTGYLVKELPTSYASVIGWLGNKKGKDIPYAPSRFYFNKLKALGVPYTKEHEQSVVGTNDYPLTRRKVHDWRELFRRKFTQFYNPSNAEGYDGDDWRIIKGLEIKPSQVEEFIEKLMKEDQDGA